MKPVGHLRKRLDRHGRMRFQMIIEVWKNGKKLSKTKTFNTEKEARSWGQRTHYEMEKGILTKESLKDRKMSEVIDRYITDILPGMPKNARNVERHLA